MEPLGKCDAEGCEETAYFECGEVFDENKLLIEDGITISQLEDDDVVGAPICKSSYDFVNGDPEV